MAERLTVGVAARLSRYLQVLTQARKTGKDRISSQEIAEYTNINATQIRRDLSAFGKFGKRGVGYRTDALLDEIRKILRTQGQHNIALVGAGRLGSAIASSPIFAEHGITIAAIFDRDPDKVGQRIGDVVVSPSERMIEICRDHSSNVKRWRDGQMVLRWCAAGMTEAASQFRRVKGYRQLPALRAALNATIINSDTSAAYDQNAA